MSRTLAALRERCRNGVCCATRRRGHFPAGACRYRERSHHALEYAEVPQKSEVDAVLAAARGNRVIAVGTTSTRSLESAAQAAKAI